MSPTLAGDGDPDHGQDAFRIASADVHVWDSVGPVNSNRYPEWLKVLDEAELARAEQFRSTEKRIFFVACRAWLRMLLAAYTGGDPTEIILATGDHGKPRLADHAADNGLVFNLSHSGNRVVYAFAVDCMLGVDIERAREIGNLNAMIERICSHRESRRLEGMEERQKRDAFLALWVRKEAIIKAQGRGIALGMKDCLVPENDNETPFSLPEACGPVKDWSLRGLECPPGFLGAVAFNRRCDRLIHRPLPVEVLHRLYL